MKRKIFAARQERQALGLGSCGQRIDASHLLKARLTLSFASHLIDTRTDDHNVVDYRKAALASDPLTFSILHPTVCQHSCLVHGDLFLMKLLRVRQFIFGKELPGGAIDDLIWSITKDVDHGIR